jgi:hypothetical protein
VSLLHRRHGISRVVLHEPEESERRRYDIRKQAIADETVRTTGHDREATPLRYRTRNSNSRNFPQTIPASLLEDQTHNL